MQRTDGISPLNLAGIDTIVERAVVHAVVDDVRLFQRHLVQPMNLPFQAMRYGDHSIGAVGAVALMVLDAG